MLITIFQVCRARRYLGKLKKLIVEKQKKSLCFDILFGFKIFNNSVSMNALHED
jgi:hypothetical protein